MPMTNILEKEIRETTPFRIATQQIKYPGIHLMKGIKDLHVKTLKHQRNKLRKTLENGKTSHDYGLEELIL